MLEGVIVKGVGGFYYVRTHDTEYECKAKGSFRHEKRIPLVGDKVYFTPGKAEAYGRIEEILPRQNQLIRPPVANITQILVTVAAVSPAPDLYLADRLIYQALAKDIKPVLVINKADQSSEEAQKIACQYANALPALIVSAKRGEGLSELRAALHQNRTCMAGQSAVGKSSLLNALFDLELKVGGLSRKTDRGRHTTRHVELIGIAGGEVLDTPGFSLLEEPQMAPAELKEYYPDFAPFAQCRFLSCLHDSEPGCGVKQAVEDGQIHPERYARYIKLLNELKQKEFKKYD